MDWTGGLDWWTGLVDWTLMLFNENSPVGLHLALSFTDSSKHIKP